MEQKFKKETLCVQAGWTPKKGEPRVLPIYQSTTFKYDTSEQMAKLRMKYPLSSRSKRRAICLTWKKADTSILVCKIRLMMPLLLKLLHWKVV